MVVWGVSKTIFKIYHFERFFWGWCSHHSFPPSVCGTFTQVVVVGRFHRQLRVSTQLRVLVRAPAGRKTNLKPIKPIDPHCCSPHHLHCLSQGLTNDSSQSLAKLSSKILPFSLQIVFLFVLVVATESFPNNQSIWR